MIRLSTAQPRDISTLVALQKLASNAVGFIPRPGIEEYVAQGWCTCCYVRSTAVAYILGRPSMRYARWCRPITQIVVHPDHRRSHLAMRLANHHASEAFTAKLTAVQAWTRDDLHAATALWLSLGFDRICSRLPDTADRVPLTLWRRCLSLTPDADYWTTPPVSGYRAARTTTAVRSARPSTPTP